MKGSKIIPGSFRDPSGFIFTSGGMIYRQVNHVYRNNYDFLINSGLYKSLTEEGLLIPHEDAFAVTPAPDTAYKIIKPLHIPFISYPYEWCFSQLKRAAMATLEIQKKCLDFGMSLKDSSAYNIQFLKGKAVFIDTLSFEKYVEGVPWVAYRQFCQHFLAPLALMSYRDTRLNQLLKIHLDGIPLDLAGPLLPYRTRLNPSLFMHIHLHARAQKHFSDRKVTVRKDRVSRLSLMGLIDNLESTVAKMHWKPGGTEWADYYSETNYSGTAFSHKKQLVSDFLDKLKPGIVWDMGSNTGEFSRIASVKNRQVISFDVDPAAVEKNYLKCVEEKEVNILPLLLDLTNPSPATGWNNTERMSLTERGPADTALALALVHHMAISNNVPFEKIADFLHDICNSLIIEFIPKEDSQVKRLLINREDIFKDYSRGAFESGFQNFFTIIKAENVKDSGRIIYMMEKRQD